jgi:hypothetical protein
MPTTRPLPPRPSLEYARKEAKALLRRLHAADADALARAAAQHSHFDVAHPTSARLADAQLVIAREHGFASWPRLVRYLGDVERQQQAHVQLHGGGEQFEAMARRLLANHRSRGVWSGRALAAYVPRFYGLRVDDVFASTITEDEARLAVARLHGAPSWEVLLERLEGNARTRPGEWEIDPMQQVRAAMEAADVSALERVTTEHPELLQPSEYDLSAGRTLMGTALWQERRQGASTMQPIMDWLSTHGFDRQRELNERLCGHIGMTVEEVRTLLEQGADPNWVAPNGIPVLEHALLRYWNGAAVDVLADHVTPRDALWIAAGLGDENGVRGFLDQQGKPTTAARRLRPDFVAAGARGHAALPDADDEELLVETLLVAMLNERTAVLEYLAARGAPLNSMIYGTPLISLAVGNAWTAVVECLVRCGADLDIRGSQPSQTAREIAREMFEQMSDNAERRRIAELCGMDPDALLAERDTRPSPPPRIDASLQHALALAGDDAARIGQPDVRPENLLIGLLRAGGPALNFLNHGGQMDVERFRAELADRVAPRDDDGNRPRPPMHADAQAALDAAIALAVARRHAELYGLHLLHALTSNAVVGELLARYGVDVAKLGADLEKGL